MNMNRLGWVLILGFCGGLVQETTAGPSLEVTKPPVQSGAILSGPMVDPSSRNGQWFIAGQAETNRTHEFYDNVTGGPAGVNAISGYVSSVQFGIAIPPDPPPITAFSIEATVYNDTGSALVWASGDNSHGETLTTPEQYGGTLVNTKIAAEFAVADLGTVPQFFIEPYRDRSPYIVADNEDQRAWYCWNPEGQEQPKGDYFVPTWDLGDIPLDISSTVSMHFSVPAGLPSSDSRYAAIMTSYMTSNDILQNRTTSLKISTWIDDLALDPGNDEEQLPLRHSSVSVFHNGEILLDFGDAPDPTYPTLLVNNGARHVIVPGVCMGLLIDAEPDGKPDANATGDDKANLDDEDGVVFLGQLLAGQTATVQVMVSTSGYVHAWLDFNANGNWTDAGEKILNGAYLSPAGIYNLPFSVPGTALATNTFARFRFTTAQTPLGYTGQAPDGEVEDHMVDISEEEPGPLDFGDAPDPTYPTLLASNGARHGLVPGVFMGQLEDPEANGQPTLNADGDDNNPPMGLDDEDGVTFVTPLYPGNSATVQVVCSVSGFLSAWLDFNADGDWADAGENIFAVQAVPAGTNALGFTVPAGALVTNTYARFRFTTLQTPIGYTGYVPNGEVEDYKVAIQQEPEQNLDFGDAMDRPAGVGMYPTLLVNNGARHIVLPGVWLGATVDTEPDGQPTPNADGDDLNPLMLPDDEDGVVIPSPLIAGASVQVQVTASVPGFLNAWIDWNSDGDWADPGEQVYVNTPLSPGANLMPLNVPVPPALVAGGPHSRWRFTTYAPPMPLYTGPENDGEVEDYEVRLEVLDFGDAPDPSYPTLLANNGARHRIPSAYWLGNAPDLEPDGQPAANADGDDNAGATPDDEDGVFVSAGQALVQGDPSAVLGVIASANGILNAWLDFNRDGAWAGPVEQIATDLPVPAGVSSVVFAIPATARLGPSIGRFRFASTPGLSPTGLALDGEVEDHVFTIYQNGPTNPAGFEITNIVHTATNQMTIWWEWESNVTYQAQWASNLLSASNVTWTGWGGYVFAPPYLQIDSNAVPSNRFYRVVVPFAPPPP